jgi:hypothetical protein
MRWPIRFENRWSQFSQIVAKKACASGLQLRVCDKKAWTFVTGIYESILPYGVSDSLTDMRIRSVIHEAKQYQKHFLASSKKQQEENEAFWTKTRTLEAMRMAQQRKDHLLAEI